MVQENPIDMQATKVSVIVPAYNCVTTLTACMQAILSSDYPHYECFVVNDGSTDGTLDLVRQFPVQVIQVAEGPRGPAYARNRGAEVAQGEILLFVDSDVVIQPDTMSKVVSYFDLQPEVHALFGSYDTRPAVGDLLSQFKNLSHHFIHQQGRQLATTFWAGCGAVRQAVFEDVGGFDENAYPKPSIEDIELGYRLTAAGYRIHLKQDIQVQHLKAWTVRGLIRTEIMQRGIPWTQLIMRYKHLPNDLNLRVSQQISAAFVLIMLGHVAIVGLFLREFLLLPLFAVLYLFLIGYWYLPEDDFTLPFFPERAQRVIYALFVIGGGAAFYFGWETLLAVIAVLFLGLVIRQKFPYAQGRWRQLLFAAMIIGFVVAIALPLTVHSFWLVLPLFLPLGLVLLLNFQLYRFFAAQRGILFMLAIVPFHLLYYLYSVIAFGLGTAMYWRTQRSGVVREAPPAFSVDTKPQ